ncbi:hypothetical protein G6F43_010068 [Rhizopus delemar]|nr:hypothetical protein G6F43_010068 [Rhizopus delemar]
MNNSGKTLKWAVQRTQKPNTRIQKRQPAKKSTRKAIRELSSNHSKPAQCSQKEINKLEGELEFAHDALATVIVNLQSIHHAYKTSESELEETKSATRLCEKEKELLTAYGEVKLQASHLERKIARLETKIASLKEFEVVSPPPYMTSPCSSVDTTLTHATPMVNYTQPAPLFDNTTCNVTYDYQQLYYQPCVNNNELYSFDQLYDFYPLLNFDDVLFNDNGLFTYDCAIPHTTI